LRIACALLIISGMTAGGVLASNQTSVAREPQAGLPASPQILVIFSDDASQGWVRELTDAINATGPGPDGASPAWYFEYLDAVRFQNDDLERRFGNAIQEKYKNRRLDLIVPVSSNAITFVNDIHGELWPGVPVLAANYAGRTAVAKPTSPNVSVLSFENGIEPVLATIKAVLPETTGVVLSSGVSEAERRREAEVGVAVRAAGMELIDLVAPSLADILARVPHLPERTVLFIAGGQVDANGRAIPPWLTCEVLSRAANRPAIMLGSQFLGCGIIGGLMRDFTKIGAIIGQRAMAAVSGQSRSETVPFATIATLTFDARQLERWQVDERRLPRGSLVAFRQPGLWRDYQRQALAVLGLLTVQAILILGLLFERRARRRAEMDSRRNLSLAAHVDRRAAMATLSGSIAHELNQPLGSILHNAEAAEMLVASNRASPEDLLEILRAIRDEDARASQIVQRHREMLQKHDLEKRPIDVHAVARESVALIAHEADKRRVAIESNVPATPCLVMGDRILLQQVVVNLILNAMDAMAETPVARRRVTIRSLIAGAVVTISVNDCGSGFAADVGGHLFEPFFTSKPGGTGIGLAIARSTIEAHDGTIEGSAAAEGGATFRFTLPLSAI